MHHRGLALVVALSASAPAPALAAPPSPEITVPWAIAQLVPSPVWLAASRETRFGARWPITPLLIAYRMPKDARTVRGFVIDPLARVSGSIELNVTPWLARLSAADGGAFGVATGLRTTLPLVEHGEGLAFTAAVSWLFLDREGSPVYEAGVSTLFGIFGVDVGYVPGLLGGAWLVSARVRYF